MGISIGLMIEGQKREDFFCLYEGNWLGTKIDCIAVLFVCVGFLFGKLIFLIIPDSVCFFFLPFTHRNNPRDDFFVYK